MKDFLMFHGYSTNKEFGYLYPELIKRGYSVDKVDETDVFSFSYQKEYRYVVICWHDQLPDYKYVINAIRNIKKYERIALYDDTDWTHIMGSLISYDIVFKREYVKGYVYDSSCPIIPISKTAPIYEPYTGPKEYDVCCILGETDKNTPNRLMHRKEISKILSEVSDLNCFVAYGTPMPFNEYLHVISISKIAINVYGNGWDTLRFWEILSAGTCLATPEPKTVIDPPFPENSIIVCREDYGDLLDKIRKSIKTGNWKTRAYSGREFFLNHHTISARADTLLKGFSL